MSWVDTRLKHLCMDTGQYGLNVSADQYSQSGVRLIRTSDISSDGLLSAPEDGVHVDVVVEPRHRLRPGDVLLSRSGTLGRSFLVPREANGQTFAGFLIRFRPRSGVDPRFLYYATQSLPFQEVVHSEAVASTIQNFNAERYSNIMLRAPEAAEQCRIADFLDAETARINQVSQLRERQRKLLEARRWSHFQAELDHAHADTIPLRRIIRSVIDGPFGSAFSSDDYVDEGAAVVRLGNIGFAEYRGADQARVPMALFERFRYHEVGAGDILIAGLGDSRNHAGRACVAPDLGAAIVKGKCFRARVEKDAADADFIALLLSSPVGASAIEGRGSTRSMINLEIVKTALLPIPPLARQRQLVSEHRKSWLHTKATISACDRQLATLAERRQALITAAVTGQFDVSTASGRNVTDGVIS